jgi:hypothetical protein
MNIHKLLETNLHFLARWRKTLIRLASAVADVVKLTGGSFSGVQTEVKCTHFRCRILAHR